MDRNKGSGWVSFSAMMILLAGTFNVIDGITALTNATFLSPHIVVSDLTTWGWVMIVLGAIEAVVCFAILARSTLGAALGIMVAMLNAIGQLFFIPSYPVWSLLIIGIDVLVIYGLAVYGGSWLESTRHV
jgi:hypothetical protein